jgi:hypothetical protein
MIKGKAEQFLKKDDVIYLIRPNGLDNLHKAIKYGIWTSLGQNNNNFRDSYEETLQNNASVYLIFAPIINSKRY